MADPALLANAAFAGVIASCAFLVTSSVPLVAMYEADEVDYSQRALKRIISELKISLTDAETSIQGKLRDHGLKLSTYTRSSEWVMRVRYFLYGLILAAAIIAVLAVSINYAASVGAIKGNVDEPIGILLLISLTISIIILLFVLVGVPLGAERLRLLRERLLFDRLVHVFDREPRA